MTLTNYVLSRFDRLTSELCDEIDQLEAELVKAKADAAYWKQQHQQQMDKDLAHDQRMMMGLLGVAIGTVPSPDPKLREMGESLALAAAAPMGELTEEQLQDETRHLAEKDPATYQELFQRPPD